MSSRFQKRPTAIKTRQLRTDRIPHRWRTPASQHRSRRIGIISSQNMHSILQTYRNISKITKTWPEAMYFYGWIAVGEKKWPLFANSRLAVGLLLPMKRRKWTQVRLPGSSFQLGSISLASRLLFALSSSSVRCFLRLFIRVFHFRRCHWYERRMSCWLTQTEDVLRSCAPTSRYPVYAYHLPAALFSHSCEMASCLIWCAPTNVQLWYSCAPVQCTTALLFTRLSSGQLWYFYTPVRYPTVLF